MWKSLVERANGNSWFILPSSLLPLTCLGHHLHHYDHHQDPIIFTHISSTIKVINLDDADQNEANVEWRCVWPCQSSWWRQWSLSSHRGQWSSPTKAPIGDLVGGTWQRWQAWVTEEAAFDEVCFSKKGWIKWRWGAGSVFAHYNDIETLELLVTDMFWNGTQLLCSQFFRCLFDENLWKGSGWQADKCQSALKAEREKRLTEECTKAQKQPQLEKGGERSNNSTKYFS